MSESAILCPLCRKPLGYRRKNGSVSVRSNTQTDGGVTMLVCTCGGIRPMENMAPVLLPR